MVKLNRRGNITEKCVTLVTTRKKERKKGAILVCKWKTHIKSISGDEIWKLDNEETLLWILKMARGTFCAVVVLTLQLSRK